MRIKYTVVVWAETAEQAQRVIAERLGYDDDYGFPYIIDWFGEDEA